MYSAGFMLHAPGIMLSNKCFNRRRDTPAIPEENPNKKLLNALISLFRFSFREQASKLARSIPPHRPRPPLELFSPTMQVALSIPTQGSL